MSSLTYMQNGDNKIINASIEDIQYITKEDIRTDIGVGQTNKKPTKPKQM